MKIEISISELLAGGKSEEEIVREILVRDGGKQYTEKNIRQAVKDFKEKQPEARINIPGWNKWKN